MVPNITETLILFGRPPVGRTSFCIEPKGIVETIPVVGGTKTPKLSRITQLNPDLIIANQEENRREDVEALERAGHLVWVTYPCTVSEAISWMDELLEVVGPNETGRRLVEECRLLSHGAEFPVRRSRPKVTVLIWRDPWMAVGSDTYAADLLRMAGAEVVPKKAGSRYPVLTREEILAADPDLLLLSSEPYPFTEKDGREWTDVRRAEVFSGEDLFWFGPRMKRALEELGRLISS